MFKSIFGPSKKELNETIESQQHIINGLKSDNAELEARVKDLIADLSAIQRTEKESSSISFYIDKELKVLPKTKINDEIIPALIDENYINQGVSDNEIVLHLAMLLIANEVSEQIIEEFEDKNPGTIPDRTNQEESD